MKNKIPSLNGLRAISIFFVILWHYILANYITSNIVTGENNIWMGMGQLGVNVFFVISGYLITTLLLNEEKKYKAVSLKQFYFRRTLRIFPAYYFLLFIYGLLQLFRVTSFGIASWITSITYTKYLHPSDVLTGHFWSLSVEEHFYIIWPIIFKYFKSYRKTFAFTIILLIPIIRILCYGHSAIWLTSSTLFQRMDAPMVGCLFAIYNNKISAILRLYTRKFRFIFIIPVIVLMFSICSGTIFNAIGLKAPYLLVSLFSSIGSFTTICVGIIMLYSIQYRNLWFQFLNLNVLDYLGRLSYSLYLWQQLFVLGSYITKIKFPYSLLCLFIAANISYFLIEKPFLKLKKENKIFNKRKSLVLIPSKV